MPYRPYPLWTDPSLSPDATVGRLLEGYPGQAQFIRQPPAALLDIPTMPTPEAAPAPQERGMAEQLWRNIFSNYYGEQPKPIFGGAPMPAPKTPDRLPMGGTPAPSPMPSKFQDRLPMEGPPVGVKGDLQRPAPGGAPSARPGPTSGAPQAGQPGPSGPLTWQQVVRGMIEANPELAKRKDGMAIIGRAAAMYLPLMQQQSQQEFRMLQQRMQMELQQQRLEYGRERLELSRQRLADRRGKGADETKAINKDYNDALRAYTTAAKELHAAPGDKNLQTALAAAKTRLDYVQARWNQIAQAGTPKQQGSDIQRYVTALAGKGTTGPEAYSEIAKGVPRAIMQGLPEDERTKLMQLLLANPSRVDEIIAKLQQKLSRETTVSKSYAKYD